MARTEVRLAVLTRDGAMLDYVTCAPAEAGAWVARLLRLYTPFGAYEVRDLDGDKND